MTMSRDRVKFYLPESNFQHKRSTNGFQRNAMAGVLEKSFGAMGWSGIMNNSPNGFWVICRPSQFARFIINRANLGTGVNGIRCLEAKLFIPEELNPYQEFANEFELTLNTAHSIIEYLGIDSYALREIVKPMVKREVVIDVSLNNA